VKVTLVELSDTQLPSACDGAPASMLLLSVFDRRSYHISRELAAGQMLFGRACEVVPGKA
jgi:hypothetical protein